MNAFIDLVELEGDFGPVDIIVTVPDAEPIVSATLEGCDPVDIVMDAAVYLVGGSTTVVDSGTTPRIAGQNLSGRRVVRAGTDGRAYYADAATPGHGSQIIGITTGAAAEDDTATIRWRGSIIESGWSWTPGAPIFVGADGTLTQAVPTSPAAAFSRRVANAVTATEIIVDLTGDPVALA